MDIKSRLGWVRGLPQKHAFHFFPQRGLLGLPPLIDLSAECPPVWDQGNLGSCTAQAGAGLSQFLMKKLGYKDFTPSRLAIYYWNRIWINTIRQDSGASLTDTLKTLTKYGNPYETLWPYIIQKFRTKPIPRVIKDASNHKIKTGLVVQQNLDHMKSCLAEGFPFIFGFTVYESFDGDVATSGICPMPKDGEEMFGGHAVMAVGYDDDKSMFKIRNSWGVAWGQKGYFWMPYAYITNPALADDFWTAREFSVFK